MIFSTRLCSPRIRDRFARAFIFSWGNLWVVSFPPSCACWSDRETSWMFHPPKSKASAHYHKKGGLKRLSTLTSIAMLWSTVSLLARNEAFSGSKFGLLEVSAIWTILRNHYFISSIKRQYFSAGLWWTSGRPTSRRKSSLASKYQQDSCTLLCFHILIRATYREECQFQWNDDEA